MSDLSLLHTSQNLTKKSLPSITPILSFSSNDPILSLQAPFQQKKNVPNVNLHPADTAQRQDRLYQIAPNKSIILHAFLSFKSQDQRFIITLLCFLHHYFIIFINRIIHLTTFRRNKKSGYSPLFFGSSIVVTLSKDVHTNSSSHNIRLPSST